MAITARTPGAIKVNTGSGDAATIALPTGHVANDILVLVATASDNVAATVTGYTSLFAVNNGLNQRLMVFWKRDGGAEATPTLTHTGGNTAQARIFGFAGASTGATPLVAGASNTGSAAGATGTITGTGITPSWTNSGIIAVGGTGSTAASTAGASGSNYGVWSGTDPTFTELADNLAQAGSRESGMTVDWGLTTDGAATGNRTSAVVNLDTGGFTWISVLIELVDASPTSGGAVTVKKLAALGVG